jgi:hypothetical protein
MMKRDYILKLQQLYAAKYGYELLASNLDQFHSDFVEMDKGYQSSATQSLIAAKNIYPESSSIEK